MKTDPAKRVLAVTLSDTTVYNGVRGFHANGDGTLVIEPAEAWDDTAAVSTVSLVVKGGAYYPYSARRFLATGSDASATLGIRAVK